VGKLEVKLGSAAALGSILLVFADVGMKGDASAIMTIKENLAHFFGMDSAGLMAGLTILALIGFGVGLSVVFRSKTMKDAFYHGASALAIAVTIVPHMEVPDLKREPNSVQVQVGLRSASGHPISGVSVVLWDTKLGRIVARSNLRHGDFTFYQSGGAYRMDVEVRGHRMESVPLNLVEGSGPERVMLTLTPSTVPLFLQRILK
jgi:hypothetical protein